MASMPMGRRSVEVDRRSIEVVPPSPIIRKKMSKSQLHGPRAPRDHLTSQPFHRSPARSASTPLLCPSSSEKSLMRPLFPSTNDLSALRFHPRPKLPFIKPTQFATRPAALSRVQPSRGDAHSVHRYTAATPPIDSAGPSSHRPPSPKMASPFALPPDAHSPLNSAGYSPSASLVDLQSYIPSFLGRSLPGSPYLPSSPVPSTLIHPSDPQNLIPAAVRAAGYNPFRHARSESAFE
jgi:hypothetical protein